MKKIFLYLICFSLAALVNGCKKKLDSPPVSLLSNGTIYTVEQLRTTASCTNSCQKRFTGEAYLIGIVLADEISGNFYKELYMRDRTGTGAIHLDFLYGNHGFFVGDSIRVLLKGLDVGFNYSTGMLEIDSIDFEKSIVQFGKGPVPVPKQITLSQLTPSNPYSSYLCDLVTINGVGFIPADTNQIWADAVNQLSINRTIQDCDGNLVVVRTSNYASFWAEKTPKGYGSITGIATAYGGTNQLAIRKPSEVNMNGTGCTIYLKKDFNNNSITSGGWSNKNVTGTVSWAASSLGSWANKPYGSISNYTAGANVACETWLISPLINLSSASNPVLSFQNAYNYSGPALTAWISTNYVSGLPSTATWTSLAFTPSTGGFAFIPSGAISLNGYKTNNVSIAFKYTGTGTSGSTWEVDDIVIKEN